MKLRKDIIIGIIAGFFIILIAVISSLIFESTDLLYFLLSIGILVIIAPFVVATVIKTRSQREKDEMFLEFSISLVESVESGTPISKSITNLSNKSFGSLSPHLEKLANQIELGIPLQKALQTFAEDTKSRTIIRAITLIREADKIGGDITTILDSVARSVASIEKLKAERRAAISAIVVEGYIIFAIFIVIMVIIEFAILPMTDSLSGLSSTTSFFNSPAQIDLNSPESNQASNVETEEDTEMNLSLPFLFLLITQGFFAGLVIGKLAEGEISAGIKHSFILVSLALIVSTGSKLIFLK